MTEFLFTIALEVPVLALGETPYGTRRIARFAGGSYLKRPGFGGLDTADAQATYASYGARLAAWDTTIRDQPSVAVLPDITPLPA